MKINVPENFNFGYDVVDAWGAEQPDKPALLWTNDQGECRQFTFADMKRYTDMRVEERRFYEIEATWSCLYSNAVTNSGSALWHCTNSVQW